jgi:hypothetical protein
MRNLSLLAVIATLFSSCTTAEFIQHTPTLVNSGMHTDKNQFTGRALYSSGSSTFNSVDNSVGPSPYQSVNGFQAQGSYSVTPNLAVTGLLMFSGEKGGSEENQVKTLVYDYKRNITEAGLSFFQPLSDRKKFFFEASAGTGFGKYRATERNSVLVPGGRFYDNNVFKLWLQPSFYFISPYVHISTGVKIASININSIQTNYTLTERETREITTAPKLRTSTTDWFFRTEVFIPGAEWIGFSAITQQTVESKQRFSSNINDSNFGLGVVLKLGQSRK